MFCGKCGYRNIDSVNYCEKCGAPLRQAERQFASEKPYDPKRQMAKKADAQKKPKLTKKKKIILISAICVAVIAILLVVIFAVIIPAVNKSGGDSSLVDMTQYLTVKVNEIGDDGNSQTVYDGKISGSFTFDSERLARDKGLQQARAASLFTRIQRFVTIDYSVLGKTSNTVKFSNVSAEDVAVVTYKWPDESSSDNNLQRSGMDSIRRIEKEYGVSFEHVDKTCEYKMGDLLREKGVTVKQSVEFDLLSYIKENNLIFTSGNRSGQLKVGIKPFDTVSDGIKYSLKKDSFNVTVSSGDDSLGSVELKFDQKINLKNNQVVTLDYDSTQRQQLEDKGVTLKGNPVKYTVKATETTTAATTAATTAPATTIPVVTTVPRTTAPQTTAPPVTVPPLIFSILPKLWL